MILNNVELIETEIGKMPVIVNEVFEDGQKKYNGKMIDNDIKIFIQTPTKETCLEGLKNAFELHIHFWLCNEIKELDVDFM